MFEITMKYIDLTDSAITQEQRVGFVEALGFQYLGTFSSA